MKKTFISLYALMLCGTALAGPIDDKVNAYNAMRANKSGQTPVLDVRALIRNEVGVTSNSPSAGGDTCAICGIASTNQTRQGAGSPLPVYNPTLNPATSSAAILTAIPAGLGVIPDNIVRTAGGTGAGWLAPDANQDPRFGAYENQYNTMQNQYKVAVSNIINSYLNPQNGKLAEARIAVLNIVDQEMAAYAQSTPNASVVERANYEAARIQANSSAITGLTSQYQLEIKGARDQFDTNMAYIKYITENPEEQGGNKGDR